MQEIMFGAGCFWCVEDAFLKVPGVVDAISGYSGGQKDKPTYQEVCTGTTGHAEVVLVQYDEAKVDLADLLVVFFKVHDPTQLNRQGPDVGTQYRSAIYFYTIEQELAARAAIDYLNENDVFPGKIVTEVKPAGEFFRAEEYHQRYYQKKGIGG